MVWVFLNWVMNFILKICTVTCTCFMHVDELFCYTLRAPGIKVESYHGSKKEKERSLAKIRRKGGVLLTSYGLVVTSWEMMSQQDGRSFRWVINLYTCICWEFHRFQGLMP